MFGSLQKFDEADIFLSKVSLTLETSFPDELPSVASKVNSQGRTALNLGAIIFELP